MSDLVVDMICPDDLVITNFLTFDPAPLELHYYKYGTDYYNKVDGNVNECINSNVVVNANDSVLKWYFN